MKFLSAASLLVLTAPLANAAAFSIFDPTQASLKVNDNEKYPVNGDNPLQYCAKPDNYKLEIESVDLAPNPPLPGQKLTISAKGTLLERIEKGATVNLEVKWGLITLIKQTVDLCEELKNVDLECPPREGRDDLEEGGGIAQADSSGQIHRACRCLQQGAEAGHLPQGG
ncbi:hypothetical protein HAV15_004265 [Penicillium sp. str. |nr:hypothetical protein HAV15_004265 [Penicillium sp. str. \